MKITFDEMAWDDYIYWQQTDKKTLKRINNLIKDISRSPFEGIGDPEPLKPTFRTLSVTLKYLILKPSLGKGYMEISVFELLSSIENMPRLLR